VPTAIYTPVVDKQDRHAGRNTCCIQRYRFRLAQAYELRIKNIHTMLSNLLHWEYSGKKGPKPENPFQAAEDLAQQKKQQEYYESLDKPSDNADSATLAERRMDLMKKAGVSMRWHEDSRYYEDHDVDEARL